MENLRINYNAETGEFYVSHDGNEVVRTIINSATPASRIMNILNGYIAERNGYPMDKKRIKPAGSIREEEASLLRKAVLNGFVGAINSQRDKFLDIERSALTGDES